MNRTNQLLDRFNRAPSLFNAIALTRHCRNVSSVLSKLNDDQAGTVRTALRMIANAERDAASGPIRIT